MNTLIFLAVLGVSSAAILDTPEVAAEKRRFFKAYNAVAQAAAAASNSVQQAYYQPAVPSALSGQWTGPVAATIPAGVAGSFAQVPETADVAQATATFLAAYRAQLAATSPNVPAAPVYYHSAPIAPVPAAPTTYKWTGPVAAVIPAGLPGAVVQVADTAEVTAAKQAFFHAYQSAHAAATGISTGFHVAPVHAPAPHRFTNPQRWTGPVAAVIPAGLPGGNAQVPDTADVTAAKAAFFQAYNQALAAGPHRRY